MKTSGLSTLIFLILLSACSQQESPNNEFSNAGSSDLKLDSLQDYYSQRSFSQRPKGVDYAFDSLFLELRNPTVPADLGERKRMTLNELDMEHGNFVSWRDKILYPPSRRSGNNDVVMGASYSFGIDEIRSLLNDIDNSSEAGSITGLRIQLYEKKTRDPKTNLIDALIVPVKFNGDPVPSALIKKKDMQRDSSLILNTSNPCPDYCD